MRTLFAALLVAAPLSLLAEPPADLCSRQLPPPRIQVRASFAEPAISFALSAREIKSMSGITLPGVSLGLTQVETRVDNRVSLSVLRSAVDGRACARPGHRADDHASPRHIYVARELTGNDCAVAAVWHHELRHFAIHQETLIEAANEVERLMRAHYEDLILFGTEDEIRAQVQHDLQQRWTPEIDAMAARGNIEHELLDARDAPDASTWCDGALLRLEAKLTRDAAE